MTENKWTLIVCDIPDIMFLIANNGRGFLKVRANGNVSPVSEEKQEEAQKFYTFCKDWAKQNCVQEKIIFAWCKHQFDLQNGIELPEGSEAFVHSVSYEDGTVFYFCDRKETVAESFPKDGSVFSANIAEGFTSDEQVSVFLDDADLFIETTYGTKLSHGAKRAALRKFIKIHEALQREK